MQKKQVWVYCKKDDVRYGDIYFKKGQFYPAHWAHDLLFFQGEMKQVTQIEGHATNTYFQDFFTIIITAKNVQQTIENKEKLRA